MRLPFTHTPKPFFHPTLYRSLPVEHSPGSHYGAQARASELQEVGWAWRFTTIKYGLSAEHPILDWGVCIAQSNISMAPRGKPGQASPLAAPPSGWSRTL
eukprot:5996700-Prymnesium_polylepis.1